MILESLENRELLSTISISDASATEGDHTAHYRGPFLEAAAGASFSLPTFGPDGNFYTVADAGPSAGAIDRYDGTTGAFIDHFVPVGTLNGGRDMAFSGGYLYVGEEYNNDVLRFNSTTGAFDRVFVTAGSGGIDGPHGLTFGPDANGDGIPELYVSGRNSANVVRYDGATGQPLGTYVKPGSGGLNLPEALTFDPSGTFLYVASTGSNRVLKYNAQTGAYVGVGASTGLASPKGVKFGPDGLMYVASADNNRILRFNANGTYVDDYVPAGSGGMAQLSRLIFGPDGDVYVSVSEPRANQIYWFGTESEALFTVTISTPSSLPVTVDSATADGSATAGVDYTATAGTLTFAPGVTSETIRVPTLTDAFVQPAETFTLNLTNPSGATITDGRGVATIHEVDAPVLQSIAVTPANPSVPAGGTDQFTATGTYSDKSTQDLTTHVTWASAITSVATISNASGSRGIATAVASGTSSISAALTGVTGTTVLTVTAAVLQSIVVTPANPSVPAGGTDQFTATGTYSDKSTRNLTNRVTWASAATSVATISNALESRGTATAVATGTSSISAALMGVTGTTVLTVTAAVLQSIALTPANPSVPAGGTDQFTATGTYSDQSTQDLTTQVTWASATTSVATISSASGSQGLATAVATGTCSISAILAGVTGTTVLTVSPAVLLSIAVTPVNPSIVAGITDRFTATGTYSDKSTRDLTTQVTWASANTSVATISNAAGSKGLATAVATGTSSISAALAGVTRTTVLTVTAAVLQSIAVTPANPSVPAGGTDQFTATGTYSDKSTRDLTNQVTWASANISAATISSATGSQGLAAAVATGTSSISATLAGVTGTMVLTVTAAVLQSIAVTPANPSVPAGGADQFHATGTYSDRSTHDLTNQVIWASANTSVATISSASGSRGQATAVATGTSSISAALAGVTGTTVLTVTAAVLQWIAVTPANPSVPAGETEAFTATGIYSDRSTRDLTTQVTWASADTSVATISSAPGSLCLATAVATGTSSISAALAGFTGTTVLTVSPAVLLSVAVTPANPSIVAGTTDQFTATGTYSDKSTKDLTTQVKWMSSSMSVAAMTSAGLATGVAEGSCEIVASVNAVTGSTVLTVSAPAPPPLVTLTTVSLVSNKRHLVTEIFVTFSGAVDMTEAQQTGIYRLATPGKHGSFTAKNAGIIRLRAAAYNAANKTAMLTPKKPFSLVKPVQLSINGSPPSGLQDSFGRLIDGDHNGQPGGNAVAVLGKSGVTLSARALARSR